MSKLSNSAAVIRDYDILYISDEVVTGFGRLGHWFASEDAFGIRPDMITCAKGLTSGYLPLGACLISDRLMEQVSGPGHDDVLFSNGYTYSGHPVSCAAALRNIEYSSARRCLRTCVPCRPVSSNAFTPCARTPSSATPGESAWSAASKAVLRQRRPARARPGVRQPHRPQVRGARPHRAAAGEHVRVLAAARHHRGTDSTRCSTSSNGRSTRWRPRRAAARRAAGAVLVEGSRACGKQTYAPPSGSPGPGRSCRVRCSPTRRRKSAVSVHASAAAIRASPGVSREAPGPRRHPEPLRCPGPGASRPRVPGGPPRGPPGAPCARPSRCPCAWPFIRALTLCERMSGSSSGSVPSRAPIASAVRSSARHAPSDIGSSVSARWISSAATPETHGSVLPLDTLRRGAREWRAPACAPTTPTAPAPRSPGSRSPCRCRACGGARPSCGPPPAPRPAAGPGPTSIAGPRSRTRSGWQVQHLVGLHQPALASRCVHLHQVPRADAHDSRTAHHRELPRHLREPPRRLLVLDGGGLAHLPRRLGRPVPELQAAFVGVELARRQVKRLAAGESSSRTAPARGCGLHRARPDTSNEAALISPPVRWMPKSCPAGRVYRCRESLRHGPKAPPLVGRRLPMSSASVHFPAGMDWRLHAARPGRTASGFRGYEPPPSRASSSAMRASGVPPRVRGEMTRPVRTGPGCSSRTPWPGAAPPPSWRSPSSN